MKSSKLSRALRLLLVGTLVAAAMSCGGSSTSSNRDAGRNGALEEECSSDTTVAKQSDKSGKKDSEKNKDDNENDNNNGEGNDKVGSEDCSPDTTFAQSAQQPVECEVSWDPTTKTATFCRDFNKFETVQIDKDNKEIEGGKDTYESDDGGNAVVIKLKSKTKKLSIKVHLKDNDGKLKEMGHVDFATKSTTTATFEYTPFPAPTTTVAAPDTTVAPDTTTAAPDTTVAADSTVAAPDTTVAAPDTTVAADTTVAPDTTVAADTTAAAQSIDSDLTPIVDLPLECAFNYSAETKSLTFCNSYTQVYVAMFDADGKYAGKSEGKGNSIALDEARIDNGGAVVLHVELANEFPGTKIPVYVGDAWMTIGDGSQDRSGSIPVDVNHTGISDTGWDSSMGVATTPEGKFNIFYAAPDLTFAMVDGKIVMPNQFVGFQIDNFSPTNSYEWRAFATDGMGLPRPVAAGYTIAGDSQMVAYKSPGAEVTTESIQFFNGAPNGGDPSEEMETGGDPCKNVSPFMVIDPASGGGTNMVTITVDSDCTSPDHMIGATITTDGMFPVWWKFLQTKYTQRISETVFLNDGYYVITWGSWTATGWYEFHVSGGKDGAHCDSAHLRVDAQAKEGTLTDCNPNGRNFDVWASGLKDGMWQDQEINHDGASLDLSEIDFTGPFWIDFNSSFQIPTFLACFTECDSSDSHISADTAKFSPNGELTATVDCSDVSAEADADYDIGQRYRDGYALEWTAYARSGDSVHVNKAGNTMVVGYCDSGEGPMSTYFKAVNIEGSDPVSPLNDNLADASLVPAGSTTVRVVTSGSTSEENEPKPWWSTSRNERRFATSWLKIQPDTNQDITIGAAYRDFNADVRVFKDLGNNGLGIVGYAWFWRYMDGGAPTGSRIQFAAKAGATYYVQVYGDWTINSGVIDLEFNGGGETVTPGSVVDTTIANTDTTVAKGADTTAVASNSSVVDTTVAGPDTTVPKSSVVDTTIAKQSDTTVARGSDTTVAKGADTTVARNTDTTAANSSDTTIPMVSPSSTTPGAPTNQEVKDSYDNLLLSSGGSSEGTIVAPKDGGTPVVEVRDDTMVVDVPTLQLYTMINNSGHVSTANLNKPLTIVVKGQRRIKVYPGQKSVRLPVSAKVTDVKVVAETTDGKKVTSVVQIKRTLPSLRKVSSDSSSTTLYAGIGAGVLVLLALFFFMKRRKDEDDAVQA